MPTSTLRALIAISMLAWPLAVAAAPGNPQAEEENLAASLAEVATVLDHASNATVAVWQDFGAALSGEPTLTEQFFPASDFYQSFALPLLSSGGEHGLRFEVVGQLYDRDQSYLLSVQRGSPADAWFSHYSRHRSLHDSDLALGLGATIPLDGRTSLRALFSNGSLPNHGDSTMALGLAVRY